MNRRRFLSKAGVLAAICLNQAIFLSSLPGVGSDHISLDKTSLVKFAASMNNDSPHQTAASPPSLLTLALIFLRLGTTAFGGPAAHIALMEEEFVRRRKWLSRENFLDLVGAANLIPGPNSTEVALHIGHTQRGLSGLVIAGICFILPAALMVSVFASLYLRYSKLPAMAGILYGLKPVIIAIVVQALWTLARTALKTKFLFAASVVVAVLYVLGVSEISLLFGSGLVASIIHFLKDKERDEKGVLAILSVGCCSLIGFAQALAAYTPKNLAYSPMALFFFFLKIGSVLYGSGYVLLAFLRSHLVENFHWISSTQLLDAIAIGQITPGPVFTAATFVGYIIGGPFGALLSTIGIFLPAFVLVALSGPVVRKMRSSRLAAQFMDAVNSSAIALMYVVLFQLDQAALIDISTLLIALLSAILLLRFRINSVWLMVGGAAIGLVTQQHFFQ